MYVQLVSSIKYYNRKYYLDIITFVFRDKTGVRSGDLLMSFKSIFQDVRNAVDWVHIQVINKS